MTIPYASLAVVVDVGTVVAVAAHALGETVDDLTGPSRTRELTTHRAVAMKAARMLGISLPVIGRAFGRDQGTVFSACKRVDRTPELVERARIIADETKAPGLF